MFPVVLEMQNAPSKHVQVHLKNRILWKKKYIQYIYIDILELSKDKKFLSD